MIHTSYQTRPIVVAYHRGEPVLLESAARLRHLYIVGQTGTGKSSLVANMIAQDVAAGHGLALIDPHGSLATDVLSLIPTAQDYSHRVVYFKPTDIEHPIGLNVLDRIPRDAQANVAGNIVAAFLHIFGEEAVADRSQEILRNALRALMEAPSPSLLRIPRLLTDDAYREKVVSRITDPVVAHYWNVRFVAGDRAYRHQATAPILNKLDHFLSNPLLRNILGQSTSSFSVRRLMDEGGILIADLSGLDEISTYMLGALLTSIIAQAALSRSAIPEYDRRPFYLYADEFPAYAGASFKIILSEARKYALGAILSHQLLAQLDEVDRSLRATIFGNVGSFVSFRVGIQDAETIAGHLALESQIEYTGSGMHETTPSQQLIQLANFTACGRFLQGDSLSPPLSLDMPPPPKAVNHRPHRIIALSRSRFARRRVKVEAGIRRFLTNQ